jgi:hypothetical protein
LSQIFVNRLKVHCISTLARHRLATAQISSARQENAKKAAQFNQGFQRNLTHCKMLSDFALYRSYGTAKYDEKYRF